MSCLYRSDPLFGHSTLSQLEVKPCSFIIVRQVQLILRRLLLLHYHYRHGIIVTEVIVTV